jgi:excisionase family DNA binding protein
MHPDEFPFPLSNPAATERAGSYSTHPRVDGAPAVIDEEVLTYREAALVLKVSARTLERWTREGRVPYIRLTQRGRWSGVRFSRNQLLRWLRQRTVRER